MLRTCGNCSSVSLLAVLHACTYPQTHAGVEEGAGERVPGIHCLCMRFIPDIPGITDKTASFPWLVDVRYVFVTVS